MILWASSLVSKNRGNHGDSGNYYLSLAKCTYFSVNVFGGEHEVLYKGRSESKERFAIQRYLLIIGKKQNMQVLSHTFTYFST